MCHTTQRTLVFTLKEMVEKSSCNSSFSSSLTREFFFFPTFILHVYLIVFTLKTMSTLSVGEEIYSLGTIFLSCFSFTFLF